ncbi:MAG: DUF1848 domain-containing protein [Actinobacteria bacterium]|nr:DUF1848 domain-containing protein [Actinomycetota bacterium]MBU2688293.1 DUF1848 domain-containing protein [Actinomycetota bacterium]
MIVSASYRTDIPAYYGEWFINRLAAGYCMVANPYGGRPYRVPLRREEGVEAFVFWTRDPEPFIDCLRVVAREHGFPFVVQYTIIPYPEALDREVTDPERAAACVHLLRDEYGPRAMVWRYDPIVFSSLTPPEWHLERFETLASSLEGATDEVVVSFAQVYRKTERNLDAAAREHGFTWEDPPDDAKRRFLLELSSTASGHGMRLSICAQPRLLAQGVEPASCINPGRLGDVARHLGIEPATVRARRKPHREDCGCWESRDIGAYHTCPHGCTYCYAVNDRERAAHRFAAHDPEGEFLLPPG